MKTLDVQSALFDLPRRELEAAPVLPRHRALAENFPPGVYLGTTSWTYPGWNGIVYGANAPPKLLAAEGLTAYSRHPLLRAVEIDRTYYAPVAASVLRAYAADVADDFRFVVKAHQDCTTFRFPLHARYGARRGEANPRYLDPGYASAEVVAPFQEGLGAKGAVLVFQFPPQVALEPHAFAARLHDFLDRLPKGITYAIELRNAELLTPDYIAAIHDAGAVHCHNAWTAMPPVLEQAKRIPPPARNPLVIRWLLREGERYEDAGARYAPFDRIQREDVATRGVIGTIVAKAQLHGVPAFVMVDNKAEGCAPESVFRLAETIVERRGALLPPVSDPRHV